MGVSICKVNTHFFQSGQEKARDKNCQQPAQTLVRSSIFCTMGLDGFCPFKHSMERTLATSGLLGVSIMASADSHEPGQLLTGWDMVLVQKALRP